jgi:excisionase family DNA binding protein
VAQLTTTSPVTPDEQSIAVALEALPKVQEYLRNHPDGPAVVRVVGESSNEDLVVPRGAVELLARILAHMANGHGVSVVPDHAELTTQQAADLLNVSRPYLIGLLEAGEIVYRLVGTHRRVLAGSVLDYKHRDDARRRTAADELTQLAQDTELG